MSIAAIIVTFSVSWWLVLFMVLPLGIRPDAQPQQGNVPSAPSQPRLKKKMGWATLGAIAITGLVYFLNSYDIVSFRG